VDWSRPYGRYEMLQLGVLRGVLTTAVALAGCGAGAVGWWRPLSLTVSPAVAGKHERITVAITAQRPTGVFGRTRRTYIVEAHAERPASGCVNNRDRVFPEGAAGTRLRARLDPARGEGGPEGWCRGRFRGTVTYLEAFACPPAGTCHPPPGFPTRTRIVGRFSFRVDPSG
jgi:hypothetical protein